MTRLDVARRRLAGQFLTTAGPANPAELVRVLGAVQAQDYAGAKWVLGQRMRISSERVIERELAEGRILRTHVLRPTWHLVGPADIRWMLALTAPRVEAAIAYHARANELDAKAFRRSNDAIAKALAGGRQLTRAELGSALAHAGVKSASGQRLAHLVMQAELDAIVCSGARRGKEFTYALIDDLVPPTAARERDDALQDLTRRYFETRGPATVHDFAWWSGLTVADAKRGVQIAGPQLSCSTVEGKEVWFTERSLPRSVASAHLLPNYDEYFIGHKDRSAIGLRIGNTSSVTGGNALIGNVIVVDGQLVGGWKRVDTKLGVAVDLQIETAITPVERRRIERAVDRFVSFHSTS